MPDQKPPFVMWAIAVVALLWNPIRWGSFSVQSNPGAMFQMPEVCHLFGENQRDWATVGGAIPVFAGVFSALDLFAPPVFANLAGRRAWFLS